MSDPTLPHDPAPPADDGREPRVVPIRELNYFAAREQALQEGFRSRRDRWLAPVVRLCLRLGVTADMVSAAAIAMLLPFGLALFFPLGGWAPAVAVTALLLHVLLDGLDGPVARAAGTDGPAGAFTDMCLDHAGYLIVTTLLAAAGLVDGAAACAYASAYTLAVVMIAMLNVLHRPMAFVVRTKYAFFLLAAIEKLAGTSLLTEAAWLFTGVHVLFAACGFIAVRRALR